LGLGVPILQAAALSVLSRTEHSKKVPVDALSDYFVMGAYLAGAGDVVDVRLETRLSFERAFGISVEEQFLWEEVVGDVDVGTPPGVIHMTPPSQWQHAEPGLYEAYIDAHI